jgi:hypothetical protein
MPHPTNFQDEPGGYNGFKALFGSKYVAPALNHSSSIIIKDLDGVAVSDGPGARTDPRARRRLGRDVR